MKYISILGAAAIFLISSAATQAEQTNNYTANVYGAPGLNAVPSARMYEEGTVSIGASTLDPYLHGFLGFQIAEPLFINIRQSAEISNINKDPDRLYPGVDLKLRLLKEGRYRPALSIGLQSAVGHKRMAGEYLALSKRYQNFDFTAGLGWGRFGTAGHFNNPFKSISNHFGKARELDGEISASPENWFTGQSVGLFGGVEYFTSIRGLSIKADYGADRYSAENRAFDYDTPAPWSLGLNYSPYEWADMALAMQGTDKIMGRLTLKSIPSQWPFGTSSQKSNTPMRPFRTGLLEPNAMVNSAHKDGALIYGLKHGANRAAASLDLKPHETTPSQLSAAFTNMANHAGPTIESISIRPTKYNLKGPRIRINRRDLLRANAHKQGSAEEIWQNTDIEAEAGHEKTSPFMLNQFKLKRFKFILDNQFSLSEEDSGALYRSSLLAHMNGPTFFGLLHSGTALRFNLGNNLDHIKDLRPAAILPVRSNVYDFADDFLSLENAYLTYTHSFTPSWHLALTGGYLEEMYAGAGGEILWRPFNSKLAIGAETWLAFKRDPLTSLNLTLNGDSLLTGHINAWYDFPERNITLKASAGRYLAEDTGATLTLTKSFMNGASIEGFATYTNAQDFDLFGGDTHAYHGVRLALPLGSIKHVPGGSEIRIAATPFGRDTGQNLKKPFDLYGETESFSYDHIARYWHEITP